MALHFDVPSDHGGRPPPAELSTKVVAPWTVSEPARLIVTVLVALTPAYQVEHGKHLPGVYGVRRGKVHVRGAVKLAVVATTRSVARIV